MAGIFAARAGAKTVVVEKNTAAGRKLLLTGGGRCNLTHAGSVDDFVRAYGQAGRFLRHALYEFPPESVIRFFAEQGLETRAEPDGCIFPVTDRASDVRDILLGQAKAAGVQFVYGRGVERIGKDGRQFKINLPDGVLTAEKVIIATGGASYPKTGSTGDGFAFARSFGHTIVEPRAALVPLVTNGKWPGELAGTSLDNVKISVTLEGKGFFTTGPMLFTQDGIGGPAALDMSRLLADYLPAQKTVEIAVDVKPAMNESKLEGYLMEQLCRYSRKIIVNVLFELIPKKLAGFLCRQAAVAETTGSQLKKEQRRKLVQLLKKLPVSIISTRPIEEATVTRGGVSRDEIDPKTMQSKICPGLYFAGEVIDSDGPCGGYNLQICWSTGALAGKIQRGRFS